jgi:lysine N6-hydroxylase
MRAATERWDVIGVGIGPSNLSLAALLDPIRDLRACFYERRPAFQWHPGLLLDGTSIQVSFVKDLVTLVDPTSRFSFLAFLHDRKRLYSFFNAEFPRVLRGEFNQYYQWASSRLRNLRFGSPVEAIVCEGDELRVHTPTGEAVTRNVVLATGAQAYVPECLIPHLGPTVFHASEYLMHREKTTGRRVLVLGGGQTGAEIVFDLLSDPRRPPAEVCWISRRLNFLPLDETPFTNEWFTPAYSDHFFQLDSTARQRLLEEQKLASDGISPDLLGALYRKLYEHRYLDRGACRWNCCPGREVKAVTPAKDGGWSVQVLERAGGNLELLEADVLILATGFTQRLPSYLEPLVPRLALSDGEPQLREDFSIEWDGPRSCRIYIQGAARLARGVADRNLSLNSWRSAKIANSLAGREVYPAEAPQPFIRWGRADANLPGDSEMQAASAGGGGGR